MIHVMQEQSIKSIHLQSLAFNENELIPKKYTCDGLNINPPIELKSIPQSAITLAVIMEDPDAPINTWIHWLVWNIPVTHFIHENTTVGINGVNDFSRKFYCGPCPMSGMHHYIFKVYVLDIFLELPANSKKYDLEKAMCGHIVAFGELTGVYGRKI
jgi:hypothetical protein